MPSLEFYYNNIPSYPKYHDEKDKEYIINGKRFETQERMIWRLGDKITHIDVKGVEKVVWIQPTTLNPLFILTNHPPICNVQHTHLQLRNSTQISTHIQTSQYEIWNINFQTSSKRSQSHTSVRKKIARLRLCLCFIVPILYTKI